MDKRSARRSEQTSECEARFRIPKRRGELAELAFAYKAASLGFGVAKPYGDCEAYDFVIDSGKRLWRVQVKSTHKPRGRGYSLTVQHVTRRGNPHYTPDEIDMLVAYIVPADAGYVLPLAAFYPAASFVSIPTDADATAAALSCIAKPGTC
jgi:hypothetical protein